MTTPYAPHALFSGNPAAALEAPRVFLSPQRYIQGVNVLDSLGRYLSLIPSHRPTVLITEGGRQRFGARVEQSLREAGRAPHFEMFGGECSYEEVHRLVDAIRRSGGNPDAVIAVGGGKCMDAGKCVAFRLSVPAVICPTLASTDAPCSAVSVMYTADGVGRGPEFFPNSPALVIVDSRVIADSPVRHLIAGIGDAIATYYEARTCYRHPTGTNNIGSRITMAALALAELCARTVMADAHAAIQAVGRKEVTPSLERVIEANTLLSGVGFESGGLAAAHAMAAGMTVIPMLHRDFLHGELVAMGLMAQLVFEREISEARRIAQFLAETGLPVTLQQLRLQRDRDSDALMDAMTAAAQEPFVRNEPFDVTPGKFYAALLEADAIGAEVLAGPGGGHRL